jgi:hypothetical protein
MRWCARAFAGLAMAMTLGSAQAQTPSMMVVVELFTSQGCSSCPPADAYLGELATRPGVLALSFHVDYWDHIGWKDPFATRAHTWRQREYSRALAQRYVYTPQIVINGQFQAVGSDRQQVEHALKRAAARPHAEASLELIDAPAPTAVRLGPSPRPASIWLVRFDRRHTTEIERGENKGKTLVNVNVVRELRRLARTDGRATTVPLDLARPTRVGDGAAVLVQAEDGGAILAAIAFDLPR